ncbi:MAG: hypothetical protein ACPL7J_13895, partial [Desulfomonilaceae bacterium]
AALREVNGVLATSARNVQGSSPAHEMRPLYKKLIRIHRRVAALLVFRIPFFCVGLHRTLAIVAVPEVNRQMDTSLSGLLGRSERFVASGS